MNIMCLLCDGSILVGRKSGITWSLLPFKIVHVNIPGSISYLPSWFPSMHCWCDKYLFSVSFHLSIRLIKSCFSQLTRPAMYFLFPTSLVWVRTVLCHNLFWRNLYYLLLPYHIALVHCINDIVLTAPSDQEVNITEILLARHLHFTRPERNLTKFRSF
jgi:hypothetical protein